MLPMVLATLPVPGSESNRRLGTGGNWMDSSEGRFAGSFG